MTTQTLKGTFTQQANIERLIEMHHDELAALDVAEQNKTEREARAKAHAAAVQAQRTEIENLRVASETALTESRNAYVKGAAEMRVHLDTEASLRKAIAKLNSMTGESNPIMSVIELERKRSLQIAEIGLRAITNNHPTKFGALSWPMR